MFKLLISNSSLYLYLFPRYSGTCLGHIDGPSTFYTLIFQDLKTLSAKIIADTQGFTGSALKKPTSCQLMEYR